MEILKNSKISVHEISDLVPNLDISKSKKQLNSREVRGLLLSEGIRLPNQVISIQMLKGGVAKTTTALNIALRFAQFGQKVLVIDLDQQANLTFALGASGEGRPVWIDILEGRATVSDCILEVAPQLHLLPSNLNNSVIERHLSTGRVNIGQSVKRVLQEIRPLYDLVIIDTAPNLSAINTSVTCASDLVILPVNPDRFSLQGLQMTITELSRIRTDFDLIAREKILFTKFDAREKASREILLECASTYKEKMLNTYVRTSVELKNSIGTQRSIFDIKSHAKEDYDLLVKELFELLRSKEHGAYATN